MRKRIRHNRRVPADPDRFAVFLRWLERLRRSVLPLFLLHLVHSMENMPNRIAHTPGCVTHILVKRRFRMGRCGPWWRRLHPGRAICTIGDAAQTSGGIASTPSRAAYSQAARRASLRSGVNTGAVARPATVRAAPTRLTARVVTSQRLCL